MAEIITHLSLSNTHSHNTECSSIDNIKQSENVYDKIYIQLLGVMVFISFELLQ